MTSPASLTLLPTLPAELRDRLPIVVGVTGHRDLRPGDRPALEAMVGAVFDRLAEDYGVDGRATPIVLLSSLAEGADRLAARVALARGAHLVVPLPMAPDEYRVDFRPGLEPGADAEFEALLAQAIVAPEMALVEGSTLASIRADPARRALQYREAGLFIVRHCHVLLALWDGDDRNVQVGGTAQIVAVQRAGVPLGLSRSSRAALDGSEIGPVVHIVTPRRSNAAGPASPSLRPFGRELRRGAREQARDRDAWGEFETLAGLTVRFNADVAALVASADGEAAIAQSRSYLLSLPAEESASAPGLPAAPGEAEELMRAYAVTDVLAQRQQRAFRRAWNALFALGLLMSAALVVSSTVPGEKIWALVAYQGLIGVSIGLFLYARHRRFQEKFLNYRAVSEALRVAVFWRLGRLAASVADAYPSHQSVDLVWVRTFLVSLECLCGRAAGPPVAPPPLDQPRYDLCRLAWVAGQRSYFTRRVASYQQKSKWRGRWSITLVVTSLAATLLIAAAEHLDYDWSSAVPWGGAPAILFAVALFPAIAVVLSGHAEQLAYKAQSHQYERMRALYERAAAILPAELDRIGSDVAKDVFAHLGQEAIDETASWTAIFRLRPIKPPVN